MINDVTLCILIASGYERAGTPAVQSERLELLLRSIRARRLGYSTFDGRILVCDDFSSNLKAQQDCSDVCARYNVDYRVKPPPWTGPCGNYNFAVRESNTEIIAMLGDDQYCTPGWWQYMEYFIDTNPKLNWGMLGWSVIFVDNLVDVGYFHSRGEFYTKSELLDTLTFDSLPSAAISGNWCNWDRPRLRGCCSGTAFIIRKSLWLAMGGFYEELYQFDEDYGDNLWHISSALCVQVPTPPIIHYGGACAWPPEKGPADERWRRAWETRPHVPIKFEDRGAAAAEIINTKSNALDDVNFMPLEHKAMGNLGELTLDLGCGKNKRYPERSIGIDVIGKPETDADIIVNLGFDRVPLPDNSCNLVMAHDVLEHIPHCVWVSDRGVLKRLTPTISLFNEVYRLLKHNGMFEIAVPYFDTHAPNSEVFQDPTHVSFWTPKTFDYMANTYENFHDIYGHTSNFKIAKMFTEGAHLHVWLQAVKE
jgi:predicted SAM-dependent methyltransferase